MSDHHQIIDAAPADKPRSFWSYRSVQMMGLYIPFVAAAGTGLGKIVAPDMPTSEIVHNALIGALLSSCLTFPAIMDSGHESWGRRYPAEPWRKSFKKAAMVGAFALAASTAATMGEQNKHELPPVSIKKACADAGHAPGARVRAEDGTVLTCP